MMLLQSSGAMAGNLDEEGCVYERRIFPEGYEMCKSGTLQRCEGGAWADIGMCDEDTTPPPADGGGDVEVEPRR